MDHSPRQGWEEAFRKAADEKDDLITDLAPNAFDRKGWQWRTARLEKPTSTKTRKKSRL